MRDNNKQEGTTGHTQSYALEKGQKYSCVGPPHLSKVGVNFVFSVLQK